MPNDVFVTHAMVFCKSSFVAAGNDLGRLGVSGIKEFIRNITLTLLHLRFVVVYKNNKREQCTENQHEYLLLCQIVAFFDMAITFPYPFVTNNFL